MVPENVFLIHALNMGIYVSFIYDILKIFRKVCPHNDFFISIEDLIFWVYVSGAVFMLMYRESNGCLRWFAVIGGLGGILVYEKFVSPYLVKYVALLISYVIRPIKKLIRCLVAPVKAIFRNIKCKMERRKQHKAFQKKMKEELSDNSTLKKRLTFFCKVLRMTL